MRVIIFSIILFAAATFQAHAAGAIFCRETDDTLTCFASVNKQNDDAANDAGQACLAGSGGADCFMPNVQTFTNRCAAVAAKNNSHPSTTYIYAEAATKDGAMATALSRCNRAYGACSTVILACDGAAAFAAPEPIVAPHVGPVGLFNFEAIRSGISFGIGIIIALLIYAKRAIIANVIIHGNLPQKVPVYAEDIQVLFKRTQRVNWYGRVVFGIIARLSMDHKQFSLVRRYWLGRVVAFDSLRRQRQNQLARMHLQLAASLKLESADKKKASSYLWTALKYYLFLTFYLLRALISFFIGFLFIRVTIAKLIRGKLVESKDLVLVLQAKDAIEDSAKYLKEYLITAETFDGREELFESK